MESRTTDRAFHEEHDIAQTLRQKRKSRQTKACYPCRRRKVKCDFRNPCGMCLKREHPELCSFRPRQATLHSQYADHHTGELQGDQR